MMVVLSPVIYWFIKKIKMIPIVLLLVIYAFDIRVSWMSATFTCASLFFCLGAYFGIKKQNFIDVLWKWKNVICSVATVLMVCQTYTGSAMGDDISRMIHPWLIIFQSFAIILLASASCKYSKLYDINKKLARTSFFIYALHPFILGYIISAVNKVMPMGDTWYVMIFKYFSAPLVCVGICIGIYWMLNKLMPGVLGVIIGERRR